MLLVALKESDFPRDQVFLQPIRKCENVIQFYQHVHRVACTNCAFVWKTDSALQGACYAPHRKSLFAENFKIFPSVAQSHRLYVMKLEVWKERNRNKQNASNAKGKIWALRNRKCRKFKWNFEIKCTQHCPVLQPPYIGWGPQKMLTGDSLALSSHQ